MFNSIFNLKHLGIAIAAFGLVLTAVDRSIQYVIVEEKKEKKKIGFTAEKENE